MICWNWRKREPRNPLRSKLSKHWMFQPNKLMLPFRHLGRKMSNNLQIQKIGGRWYYFGRWRSEYEIRYRVEMLFSWEKEGDTNSIGISIQVTWICEPFQKIDFKVHFCQMELRWNEGEITSLCILEAIEPQPVPSYRFPYDLFQNGTFSGLSKADVVLLAVKAVTSGLIEIALGKCL